MCKSLKCVAVVRRAFEDFPVDCLGLAHLVRLFVLPGQRVLRVDAERQPTCFDGLKCRFEGGNLLGVRCRVTGVAVDDMTQRQQRRERPLMPGGKSQDPKILGYRGLELATAMLCPGKLERWAITLRRHFYHALPDFNGLFEAAFTH